MDAKPLAAVFSDGSTWGDVKDVADLIARRNAKLTALAGTASILCQNSSDKPGAVSALEALNSKNPEAKVMLNSIETATYADALDKLKRGAPSREVPIPEILSGIETAGKPLFEDPVKDPSGALYIKIMPAQLSCH